MSYLLYSTLPSYSRGQIDIIEVTESEEAAKIIINTAIRDFIFKGDQEKQIDDLLAESLGDIKEKPDGFYVLNSTIYQKRTVSRASWIWSRVVNEVFVDPCIHFHIKEIPKKVNLAETLSKSLVISEPIEEIKLVPQEVKLLSIMRTETNDQLPTTQELLSEITRRNQDNQDMISACNKITTRFTGLYLVTSDGTKMTIREGDTLENNMPCSRPHLVLSDGTKLPLLHSVEAPIENPIEEPQKTIGYFGCLADTQDGKMCYGICEKGSGYCDEHKPKEIDPVATYKDRKKRERYVHELLNKLIKRNDLAQGKVNKLCTIRELFDFVAFNGNLFDKLKQTIISKLEEFQPQVTPEQLQYLDIQKYLDFFKGPVDLNFIKSININEIENIVNSL